jgi:large subunit ribosomal protein L2
MAIKSFKPITPSRRHYTALIRSEITKEKPEKGLTKIFAKNAGRNNQGKITMRFRGGGAKMRYRLVDFKQQKRGVPARVLAIEYDPNRTSYIALIQYEDGQKSYILAPQNLKVGETVICGEDAPLKIGNRLPLEKIPLGVPVYNVELVSGLGGTLVRSAGSSAQLVAKEGDWALLRMPSGEVRKVLKENWASIGVVSNPDHFNVSWGKAGRRRHLGRKPHVRGKAMNPVDHPHGGGEGKNPIGLPGPKTPWGKPTLGYKTRKRKYTDVMIVRDRRSK